MAGARTGRRALPLLLAITLALAACGSDEGGDGGSSVAPPTATGSPPPAAGATDRPTITKPAGPAPSTLQVKELAAGTGPAAAAGDLLTVDYVGAVYETGDEFDNSYDRGEPFQFELGSGMVIPGWEQGLVGLKEGGRRQLTIPPDLGYGAEGTPDGSIPPNSTLIFTVDLVKIG